MKGWVRLVVGPTTWQFFKLAAENGHCLNRTNSHYVDRTDAGRVLIVMFDQGKMKIELPLWPDRYSHLEQLDIEEVIQKWQTSIST